MYNLTNFSGNETGLLTFTQSVNSNIMGGWLGSSILIGVFLVMYIAIMANTNDYIKAGITSSFIGFILGMGLLAVGLTQPLIPWLFLIMAGVHAALSWRG